MSQQATTTRDAYSTPSGNPADLADIERLWTESAKLLDFCRDPSAVEEAAVVGTICRAARNLADADGACVIFREGELVHYSQEDTIAPLWAGQKFPITNCISGWSILHRERVAIEDIYADDRIPAEYYRSTFVKSLAMQPIEPHHPIGAIGVYWSRHHRAGGRELALLEKLADVAALVLQNSALQRQWHAVRSTAAADGPGKDEFLTIVSHELRSPLNTILGWTTLLRKGQTDGPFLARALEVIERSGKAAARLIDDLLDMSRIQSGKLGVEAYPLPVGPLLVSAIEAVNPAAANKNIALELTIEPIAGHVLADAIRLQQVVSNLLSNAIKFTPAGGRVQVSAVRKEQRVLITVADNGIGIAPEFLPHVFERYRQADGEAGKRRCAGLGLGLAIARHIVELLGGTIEARSDGEGRGAAFTVSLPAVAAKNS